MPDFFDLVRCPDCGMWHSKENTLQHRQSHDRSQRQTCPIVFHDLTDDLDERVQARGSKLDIEV